MDEIRYNLKTLHRQFQQASGQRTASANNLIALLEQSFPGICKLFDSPPRADGHQKWVDFVNAYPHADSVRGMSLKKFTKSYQKWCKSEKYNFSEEKAAEIYAAANEMVILTLNTELHASMVRQAAEQLTAISKSVEIYRAEMGDVTRFAGKQSPVAFAGVDPMPNQSGEKNTRSNKTSKRGSPYLRKALFNVMDIYLILSPQDKPIYQFLDRKRAEGKPYYVYMTAGANKFLRRYYARVRDYLHSLESTSASNNSDPSSPS